MRNPVLLFIIWFFFFLMELLFPWQFHGILIRPIFSYLVLGYVFFHLPIFSSLLFAGSAFVIESSFSFHGTYSLIPLFALFGVIFTLRKKTFRENLGSETLWVFLIAMGSQIFIESLLGFTLPWRPGEGGIVFFIYLVLQFLLVVLLYWVLKEPGELWEDRLLAFRAKSGQLNLFEARQLKTFKRRSSFKIQRRIRKRFGLDARW